MQNYKTYISIFIFLNLIFLIVNVVNAQTTPDVFCFNNKAFCRDGTLAKCSKPRFKPKCTVISNTKPVCCRKTEKHIRCNGTALACPFPSSSGIVDPSCTPPPIGFCCNACSAFDTSTCSCIPTGCEKLCTQKQN